MRSHLYRTIQSLGGNLIQGASVSVFEAGTTTSIAQVMHGTVAGSDVLSNPFLASTGIIDFYLDSPQDVDLQLTYGAAVQRIMRQPVLPPASTLFAAGAPVTITNGPSAGYLLQGVDATHAQFVDPNSVTTNHPDAAMPVPSTPTIERRNGLAFIMWDGLDNAGHAMPSGFAYVLLQEIGDSPRTLGSLLAAGGLVPNVDPGVSLQLVAVNVIGNAGTPSQLVVYTAPNAVVSTGPSQLTVGSAGLGSPLPATPARYLPIQADDGVTYLVPLYLVS